MGLAKKVWENDKEVHPIYSISLEDVKEFNIENNKVFSGISVAYKLHHNTR